MHEANGSELSAELLKSDTRGRVRVSAKRRGELLAEFERSGLSGARFASLHGINYQTFMGWRRKRPTAAPGMIKPPPADLGFREVLIAPVLQSSSTLEIELPGQIRLTIANREQAHLAAHLIRHLHGPESC